MGRTRERFCQDVAVVLGRPDPPVVESTCRHVLPRVVVVDLDVLRACRLHGLLMMARAPVESVKIGVAPGWGNPSSSRKLRRKMASAPASLAATYSDPEVERATVEMVCDFQEIAAPPMRNT